MFIIMAKRKIVAKEHKPCLAVAQLPQKPRHAGQVFALQLDNLERQTFCQDLRMDGLDQRAFAHPTCAPKESVVGGQAFGKLTRVHKQGITRALNSDQQREINTAHLGHRHEPVRLHMPNEGVRRVKIGRGFWRRAHPLKRGRYAGKLVAHQLLSALSSASSSAAKSSSNSRISGSSNSSSSSK